MTSAWVISGNLIRLNDKCLFADNNVDDPVLYGFISKLLINIFINDMYSARCEVFSGLRNKSNAQLMKEYQ